MTRSEQRTLSAPRKLQRGRHQHALTKQQLKSVSKELDDTKLQLSASEKLLVESQQATFDIKQELESAKIDLRRTKFHCAISQTALSDLQHIATEAWKEADAAVQNGRVNLHALSALNSLRQQLNPAYPAFDLSSSDFDSAVQSFASEIHSQLPAQHHRAVEELESCIAANHEYAKDLRAFRAENLQLRARLALRTCGLRFSDK